MNKIEFQNAIKNALELSNYLLLEKLCEDYGIKYTEESNTEILHAFAVLELHKMNEEKALDCLDKALQLNPDFKPALELRSYLHKNLQNDEESLNDLNSLLNLDSENTSWRLQRIELLKLMEDREGIENDFRFLISKAPLEIDFRVSLGNYYMEIAEYQEAVYCFSDVIDIEKKLGTSTYHPFLKRADAYLNNGDYNKSTEDFKTVLKWNGDEPDAYYGLASCFQALKNNNQALAYIDLGLDLVTDKRWMLYQKKAEIAKDLQNWDEVEIAYKGMTRDIQGRAEGFYQLGLLYLRQGDRELAFEMLKEAENYFHENAEDVILTHCQNFLQSDKKILEKDLIESYADEFVKNEKSAKLKFAFGKLWILDEKRTIDNNAVLNNLPAEMLDKILETFKSMMLRISPKGFYIFNLGQEDSRSLYSIDNESGDKITIQVLRFDSSEAQSMEIRCGEDYLVLNNPGGSKTNLSLYFFPAELKSLSDVLQKDYKEKESAGNMDFLK